MNPYIPSADSPETVPFEDVIYGLARSLGMSPEEEGLQRSIAHQMAEAITTAYKVVYEFHDWPDACPELPVTTVPRNDGAFIAKRDGDIWIGQLLAVYDANPETTAAQAVEFREVPGGYFLSAALESVYIRYRPTAPRFTAAAWDPHKAYRIGALVWDDTDTGHVYECRQKPRTSGTAITAEDYWIPVPILTRLAEATKAGAKALYLQSDSQFASAQIVESAVIALLEHEIQLIHNQGSQHKTYRR